MLFYEKLLRHYRSHPDPYGLREDLEAAIVVRVDNIARFYWYEGLSMVLYAEAERAGDRQLAVAHWHKADVIRRCLRRHGIEVEASSGAEGVR